jgi:hypothetical protein
MPAEPVLPPTKVLQTSERQSRDYCYNDCRGNIVAQCHGACSLSCLSSTSSVKAVDVFSRSPASIMNAEA